eukprot:Amastigsp_a773_342.p5 type:complete len:105 gc:universal Amastigsp_a773_342:1147-833(-)
MLSPRFMSSKASLTSASGMVWVMKGSRAISPSRYRWMMPGSSMRPLTPPNAVPCQRRPVTSWNGRVEISVPDGATPMIVDTPQPLWQHSSAARIVLTLPMASKE